MATPPMCKCGHPVHDHSPVWVGNQIQGHANCTVCQCPQFDFVGLPQTAQIQPQLISLDSAPVTHEHGVSIEVPQRPPPPGTPQRHMYAIEVQETVHRSGRIFVEASSEQEARAEYKIAYHGEGDVFWDSGAEDAHFDTMSFRIATAEEVEDLGRGAFPRRRPR